MLMHQKHKILYVSKLAKDFLYEPFEKTTTPKSFAYHHMMSLFVEFFNTWVPLSAGVESIFSLSISAATTVERCS